MRKTIQIGAAALLAISAVLGSPRASGQQSAEELRKSVDDLVKRLDEVQKKLDEVEKKQAEQPAVVAAPAAPAAAPKPKGLLDVYWKEGLRLDSAENEYGVKPFQLKITGRVQLDMSWQDPNDALKNSPIAIDSARKTTSGAATDNFKFRRARLAVGGIIYRDFEFMAEYDFAEVEKGAFKDVWMAANNIPYVGTIRIGQYKEFGSLDELTSDNDTVFIERALPNVFAPSRNVGIGLTNAYFDKRMTASFGVFRDSGNDTATGGGNGNYAYTARITGLPYYYAVKNARVDKLQLVHLGAWTSYRENNGGVNKLEARPENGLAPKYLTTFSQIGSIDSHTLFGAELGTIYGPFSAQAEYMFDQIDRAGTAESVMMQGAYVQAAYLLTGEHRQYKNTAGTFDKVIPKRNFQIVDGRGPGAWELALRYSYLDFEDENVHGGTQHDVTAGVNWFLNPNMRVSLNYVHAWIDRDTAVTLAAANPTATPPLAAVIAAPVDGGSYDGFIARFQVTF